MTDFYHKNFTGETDERHYLDLRQGPFFYRFADARLEYVVEKHK